MEKGAYSSPADIMFYIPGKGIVLKEKSLIAIDTKTAKVLAIGNEVESRTDFPEDVVRYSPFQFGEIKDYTCAEQIMKHLFSKAFGRSLSRPSTVLCYPENVSLVSLKACEDMMYQAGSKSVTLYCGGLDSFLQNTPEKELAKYKGIVSIEKEEPLAYAKEIAGHALALAKKWGMSKQQFLDFVNSLEEV